MTNIVRKNLIKFTALGLSCVAVLALVTTAHAQDNPAQMTLSEAISSGVMTNPEYGVVAATRRATDEELEQAKALYLPSIDFSADTGYEYTKDVQTENRIGEDDDESLWRYEAGLTLTQMLFDGFETKIVTIAPIL